MKAFSFFFLSPLSLSPPSLPSSFFFSFPLLKKKFSPKDMFIDFREGKKGRGREKPRYERETLMQKRIIDWLTLVGALSRYQTCNLGI